MITRRVFWLSMIFVIVLCRKHHHSTEEEDEETEGPISPIESKGKEIVDRMLVNIAGAAVKSIFPEMDKLEKKESPLSSVSTVPSEANPSQDIRRAPYPSSYGGSSQDSFGLPPMGGPNGLNALSALGGGGGGGNNQLGALVGSLASSGALGALTGQSGGSSGMDPRMVNEMRNQAYLAELAKHQHELTQYSSKQMEYLDQQRRYQQSLIDHQAEAALMMQKDQQKQINEQMFQAKAMYAKEKALQAARARARGSRTFVPEERSSKPSDHSLTSDSDLRGYFKQQYGIDIPEDGASLTDDERETLRMLKVELAVKKSKGGSIRDLEKMSSKKKTSHSGSKTPISDGACNQCMPLSVRKLRGAWTQVYGNPDVIKQTFGTILSLEKMNGSGSKRMSSSMNSRKPACVGMEVGNYRHGESEINFFFREDSEGHLLHEMRGEMIKNNDQTVSVETDMYSSEMCLVKAGPTDADKYEYVVFAETKGSHSCRALHVFARNTDEFNRRHFDDISDFMKMQVSQHGVLSVGTFAKSELCQLLHS